MIQNQEMEQQEGGEVSQGQNPDTMEQELEDTEKQKKVYKTAKVRRLLKKQEEDVNAQKLEEAANDILSGKIKGIR